MKPLIETNICSHPKLSDDVISAFERKYSVSLPISLIEILKVQNGGHCPWGFFSHDEKQFGIGSFLGINLDKQFGIMKRITEYDLGDDITKGELDELFGSADKLIAFADYTGHDMYCLNYNIVIPSVVYVEMDGKTQGVKLADTFDAFLKEDKWSMEYLE